MLKIRLKRIGRKHDPSFRIVVTEATAPPKGKYKEAVGFYNSALKQLKLNAERIKYWLSVGAQPTDVVHNILIREGVIKGKKKAVHSTRTRKSAEKEAEDKVSKDEKDLEIKEDGSQASNIEDNKKAEVVDVKEKQEKASEKIDKKIDKDKKVEGKMLKEKVKEDPKLKEKAKEEAKKE